MKLKSLALFLWKGGILGLALLLTAALSAVTTMRVVLTSQEVTVPSLVDKLVPEAAAALTRESLLLRVEGRRHDPEVAADRVAAQDPPGGSRLKAHRSVRVWVSLGAERLTVPLVEGSSVRTARLAVEQARLTVARVVEVDAPTDEGTVLVQRPPAGETDGVAGGVSLLASRGRAGRDYLMPDLIGRKAEDVLDALRRAGLKVADVRYRSYPGIAPGVVLRQAPAAGHRVSPRSTVSLDVSRASS